MLVFFYQSLKIFLEYLFTGQLWVSTSQICNIKEIQHYESPEKTGMRPNTRQRKFVFALTLRGNFSKITSVIAIFHEAKAKLADVLKY